MKQSRTLFSKIIMQFEISEPGSQLGVGAWIKASVAVKQSITLLPRISLKSQSSIPGSQLGVGVGVR